MKGKAHDELHKWLLPYIDLVKELSEAKDETEAEKNNFKIFKLHSQHLINTSNEHKRITYSRKTSFSNFSF